MTLGIVLKGMNALYFNEKLDFYFEFIPMIIFDMCFFGYMVIECDLHFVIYSTLLFVSFELFVLSFFPHHLLLIFLPSLAFLFLVPRSS
jgi:hypothetical protein